MESKIITDDFRGLNNFVKALSDQHVVRVGIMGAKNSRKDPKNKGLTNAEVGFQNEFGVPGRIPARSFLRMPIFQYAEIILDMVRRAGAQKKLALGDNIGVLKDLGVACETMIQNAFATRGFGSWANNAPSTIARKKSDSPLIDTTQLRRAITSVVTKP